VLKYVREYLGLREGEDTTRDLLFTVETVACIGACALAPAMMVNEDVYGLLTEEKVKEILERYEEGREGTDGV